MAASVRARVHALRELETALTLAKSEIEFLLTPLPELFLKLSEMSTGSMARLFRAISFAMRDGKSRSVHAAFGRALDAAQLPEEEAQLLRELGQALGKYDLRGQTRALDLAVQRTHSLLARLEREKRARCRSYGMLGICAGLAAAILLV